MENECKNVVFFPLHHLNASLRPSKRPIPSTFKASVLLTFLARRWKSWNREPDWLIRNADRGLRDEQTLCEGSDYKLDGFSRQIVKAGRTVCLPGLNSWLLPSLTAFQTRVVGVFGCSAYDCAAARHRSLHSSQRDTRAVTRRDSVWNRKPATICLLEKRIIMKKATTLV